MPPVPSSSTAKVSSGSKARTSPGKTKSKMPSESGGKKLSSLSSFQATLSFSSVPPSSSSSISSNNSLKAPTRSLGRTKSQDARLMPPPLTTLRADKAKVSSGAIRANGTGRNGEISGMKNSKGKEKEVIEVLDDDEDDQGRTGNTSARRGAGNMEMWTELYAPTSEVDLVPGKARIAKVRAWLHEALYGVAEGSLPSSSSLSQMTRDRVRKYKRILLVTGPAGIGKTTTVKVLAREMGVDLIEWGEGVEEYSLGTGGFDRESPITKMSAFLLRHSYAPLTMSNSVNPSPSKRPDSQSSSSTTSKPRVLLLTSLPNISHLPTRDAFHSALLEFCKTFTSSSCPMIIIHSDAGSGGKAEDSWMDKERGGREGALELLGKEVKDGLWCQEVDFLPLAVTFMSKALKRVLSLAVPEGAIAPPPSAIQLISMSSNGDLRSAINSLQMLCSRKIETSRSNGSKRSLENGGEVVQVVQKYVKTGGGGKGKGSKGGRLGKVYVADEVRAVLDAITSREQSLNLFHALGKVFYNKRLGDPNEDETEEEEVLQAIRALPRDDRLPSHLIEHERRKSLVQMETFIPTIPIDASSFTLWIHQSLPAFCTEIEQVSEAIDDYCRADVMRTDDDIWQSSTQAISYALHLTVRGSQMALPSPVPRKSQKVLKPEFFERYRKERENLACLDTAAAYIVKKGIASSVALSERHLNEKDDTHAPWSGMLSKSVLAGEVLPMMVKMQGFTKNPLLPASVASLRLPLYTMAGQSSIPEELASTTKDVITPNMEATMAGEDGLGEVPTGGEGWDHDEFMNGEEEEEKEFLEDDDIQDWD